MAKHNVYLNLPTREIGKVDALLYIYSDDELLGTIKVSKGGLDYSPSKKKGPIKISWAKFDQLLKEYWHRK